MNPEDEKIFVNITGGHTVVPVDISESLPRQTENSYDLRFISEIERVVVHTTNWETTPERLAQYDIAPYTMYKGKKVWNHISKKGCPAITYHEIVMPDLIYKTLNWKEVSWHAGNWNPSSLAIAMMYKSQDSNKNELAPPEKMLKLTQTRCGDICLELGLPPISVVGHRELKGTGWFMSKGSRVLRKTCPGLKVDLDLMRFNIAKYMQIKLMMKGMYSGVIDGIFGPKSRKALDNYRK